MKQMHHARRSATAPTLIQGETGTGKVACSARDLAGILSLETVAFRAAARCACVYRRLRASAASGWLAERAVVVVMLSCEDLR